MPATAPLPAALISKIKSRSQSVRFEAVLREVREFRAYCCNIDSDTIMGVSKQPVIILTIDPNPVCLGNAINWDFTGSYAPGSSITSRSISFGDSTTIDPAGVSGTHTYASAGTFTISATVTEGTGLTQTVTEEVNVIDCGNLLLLQSIYAFTDGSGVYYFE
jgi:PKD repeat protein